MNELYIKNHEFMRNYEKFKIISLGGACTVSNVLENTKLRHYSLPFDYMRSTFEGIILLIQNINNFNEQKRIFFNYIHIDKSSKFKMYIGKHFTFVHHNIEDKNIKNSFLRRLKRFNSLLIDNSKPLLLFRMITDENPYNELKNIDKINNLLKKINNNYKLILIITNQNVNENKINYYKISKNTIIYMIKCCHEKSYFESFNIIKDVVNNYDNFTNYAVNIKLKTNPRWKKIKNILVHD